MSSLKLTSYRARLLLRSVQFHLSRKATEKTILRPREHFTVFVNNAICCTRWCVNGRKASTPVSVIRCGLTFFVNTSFIKLLCLQAICRKKPWVEFIGLYHKLRWIQRTMHSWGIGIYDSCNAMLLTHCCSLLMGMMSNLSIFFTGNSLQNVPEMSIKT